MRFADVAAACSGTAGISAGLWAAATILGEARTASNDGVRAPSSNRGAQNTAVDVLGAFGELFLLRSVWGTKDAAAIEYMRSHLFRPEGGAGVSGPDLLFVDADTEETLGFDVKTFDCAPNKRYFAINDAKHEALRGVCTYYVCMLAFPYGKHVALARPVPYADVDTWSRGLLRSGGSPSRNLSLVKFEEQYLAPGCLAAMPAARYSVEEIAEMRGHPAVQAGIKQFLPALCVE